MSLLFYDIYSSYEDNYKRGPNTNKFKKPLKQKEDKKHKFLGFDVKIPFGIAAGPLLNSKFMKFAFDYGFDVSTYKTVRADFFPCHPYPNVLYVDASTNLYPNKTPRLKSIEKPKSPSRINITNSFGVPSQKAGVWQKDVEKSLSYQKEGQLMILSFMGTTEENQTKKQLIEDFVKTARLAKKTESKVLEVNLSCPNIGNEGLVCYDLKMTEAVCKGIRKAIGKTPLVIKVGYYKSLKDIEKLAKIVNKYANAVASINTLQVEVVDKKGNQALPGNKRLRSGVCGASIKWAGIEMVRKLNKIRKKNNYKFEIIGIGGVLSPKDYFDYRKSGADLVQSATGAMWNPYLAYEILKKEVKK